MYADYLPLLSKVAPFTLFALFFLGLMRVAPIVALVPFLGSKSPSVVKMGLAILLALLLLPYLVTYNTHPVSFDLVYLGYAFKELFIGLILTYIASVPFYIAQSAGVLIDFSRGSSALMVQDPLMQNQASPLGLLYNYIFLVLFFQIEGPFLFFDAIFQSYEVIPADTFLSASFFGTNYSFWLTLMQILNKIATISIQLAAPSLVAILMAEMFLGIANRLAPQVQIAFLGLAFKSLLGIGLLWAGWFFILSQMGKQALSWLQALQHLIQTFLPAK